MSCAIGWLVSFVCSFVATKNPLLADCSRSVPTSLADLMCCCRRECVAYHCFGVIELDAASESPLGEEAQLGDHQLVDLVW